MKKILVIFISIISLFAFTGCGTGYETYDRISYLKFAELKEQEKTFPLVIGSATCSACQMYEETMTSFIKKNNIQVYFIDLDELSDEDERKLRSEVNFKSTPTTVFYVDGKLSYNVPDVTNDDYDSHWAQGIRYLVGAGDIETVTNLFNQNNYKVK